MSLIEWKDTFCAGFKEIDEHAKQFVSLLNLIDAEFTRGAPVASREALLSTLISFCQFHFEYEERLMVRIGFPGKAQHNKEHDEFYARASSWDPCQEDYLEFIDYLGRWARKHFDLHHAELRWFAGTHPEAVDCA